MTSGDLVRILFGEILGVSREAILLQLAGTLLVILTVIICARPFLLLCFDPEQAQAAGFKVRIYHNLMLALVAVTVIVSFQSVGTLLVFGMLLAPAGAAALIARRVPTMMAWASGLGMLSVLLGLLASYHFGLATGASIVLCTTIIFFIVFIIRNLRAPRREAAHD